MFLSIWNKTVLFDCTSKLNAAEVSIPVVKRLKTLEYWVLHVSCSAYALYSPACDRHSAGIQYALYTSYIHDTYVLIKSIWMEWCRMSAAGALVAWPGHWCACVAPALIDIIISAGAAMLTWSWFSASPATSTAADTKCVRHLSHIHTHATRPTSATEPSVQLDPQSWTVCRRTSDSQTCRTAVSDSRCRPLCLSTGTTVQCESTFIPRFTYIHT